MEDATENMREIARLIAWAPGLRTLKRPIGMHYKIKSTKLGNLFATNKLLRVAVSLKRWKEPAIASLRPEATS